MSTLALFDLDHTLLPFDSDTAWWRFTGHYLGTATYQEGKITCVEAQKAGWKILELF